MHTLISGICMHAGFCLGRCAALGVARLPGCPDTIRYVVSIVRIKSYCPETLPTHNEIS